MKGYREFEEHIEQEVGFVRELAEEYFIKPNARKEYLNKLDRFSQSIAFSKALGSEEEFTKLLLILAFLME